ncbi:hypothetical protein PUN28_002090 [Cardiocondyla obscurior]|uniref:RNA-directed DNA polymerase n=1 Tax=Cardiocondyla obscurior TaxID=286306 RepID=A0AAW2GSH5_9HYME
MITIPARTQTTLYVNVSNELRVGYIPRLRVGGNVILGDAVVTHRDEKAYCHAINPGEQDQEIIVLSIDLEKIETVSKHAISVLAEDTAHINSVSISKEDQVDKVTKLRRLDHLNQEKAEHAVSLIHKHHDLFHLPGETLGNTNVASHKITTTDNQSINTKQYSFSPIHKNEIDRQVKELLDNKVTEESKSLYNSPQWIVLKKPDSKGNNRWKLVIDFRALNEKTLGDAYSLPNITEILDQLGSSKYFSDLTLRRDSIRYPCPKKTLRKPRFLRPLGTINLNECHWALRMLQPPSKEQLLANLKHQPDKSEFLRKEVGYLEHIINEDGVKPDPKKIIAVKNFPRPKDPKNIKQFLGLAGNYRRFIPGFSKEAKPLTQLLKTETAIEWSKKQEEAFCKLRNLLCSEPLLQHP